MTSYIDYTATTLEVRTDMKTPNGVAIRIWIGWDVVDPEGRSSNLVYGGYFDLDPAGPHYIVVGKWLRKAARIWEGRTCTNGAFIFDAIESIMEVLGDDKSQD